MATSFRPSTPEAGSMTRPPRNNRSNVVLTDMVDLLRDPPANEPAGQLRSMLRILILATAVPYIAPKSGGDGTQVSRCAEYTPEPPPSPGRSAKGPAF